MLPLRRKWAVQGKMELWGRGRSAEKNFRPEFTSQSELEVLKNAQCESEVQKSQPAKWIKWHLRQPLKERWNIGL